MWLKLHLSISHTKPTDHYFWRSTHQNKALKSDQNKEPHLMGSIGL